MSFNAIFILMILVVVGTITTRMMGSEQVDAIAEAEGEGQVRVPSVNAMLTRPDAMMRGQEVIDAVGVIPETTHPDHGEPCYEIYALLSSGLTQTIERGLHPTPTDEIMARARTLAHRLQVDFLS